MYQVDAIPAFSENYLWALHNNQQSCAIVDPGQSEPVLEYLKDNQFTLTEILITHHHADHIGGVKQLLEHFPDCHVYAPNTQRFQAFSTGVDGNSKIQLKATGQSLSVIELPGHTRDHIGYFDQQKAFVGDTLFSVGCGRLFEGSPEQMLTSLEKLAALHDETLVYCAHEYTMANIQFAKTVNPNNSDLMEYERQVIERRNDNQPTIPTKLATQKLVNPFLRCNDPDIVHQLLTQNALLEKNKTSYFTELRAWKDRF